MGSAVCLDTVSERQPLKFSRKDLCIAGPKGTGVTDASQGSPRTTGAQSVRAGPLEGKSGTDTGARRGQFRMANFNVLYPKIEVGTRTNWRQAPPTHTRTGRLCNAVIAISASRRARIYPPFRINLLS